MAAYRLRQADFCKFYLCTIMLIALFHYSAGGGGHTAYITFAEKGHTVNELESFFLLVEIEVLISEIDRCL